jgi:prepilin-type N-terminal cleavage/methylation domain-containing protein
MRAFLTNAGHRVRHDDDGFTLIELLTGLVIGTIIVAAAFAATIAANKSQTTTGMRIDATNRGRNAMEAITSSVRSQQCALGTRPMIWGSDNGMEFYASEGKALTSGASAGQQPIQRHRIEWIANAAGAKTDVTNNTTPLGDIVETTWTAAANVTPFVWGAPTTQVLAEDVERARDRRATAAQQAVPLTAATSVPFFEYYKYAGAVGDGRIDYTSPVPMVATASSSVNPLGLPSIASGDLTGIVLIEVSFRVPLRKNGSEGSSVTSTKGQMDFYNTISVRIADPNNPAGSPTCL